MWLGTCTYAHDVVVLFVLALIVVGVRLVGYDLSISLRFDVVDLNSPSYFGSLGLALHLLLGDRCVHSLNQSLDDVMVNVSRVHLELGLF